MPASLDAAATLPSCRSSSARRNPRSPYPIHASRNARKGCAKEGASGVIAGAVRGEGGGTVSSVAESSESTGDGSGLNDSRTRRLVTAVVGSGELVHFGTLKAAAAPNARGGA